MGDERGARAVNGLDPDLSKAVRGVVAKTPSTDEPLYVRVQHWTQFMVMHTSAGFYLDTAQTVLSLLACIMYVVSTYAEDQGPTPPWMVAFEWIVFVVFLGDYIIHLIIAENKVAHLTSWSSIVDLLSILPILTISSSTHIGFLRVLRVFRVIRIMRGYRSFRREASVSSLDSGVKQQVAVLVFTVLALIFMGSGLVHSVELARGGTFYWPGSAECDYTELAVLPRPDMPSECRMDFFQAVYFVFITITTVGYGDMAPNDNIGRLVVLVILLPLLVIIPREVITLAQLMERRSRFSAPFASTHTAHVIVCGDIDYGVAVAFLAEFFHEDHGDQKMKVVFLAPQEPQGALAHLVSNPLFAEKVQYVRGTPLSTRDLGRARLAAAHAVFVLTSQFAADTLQRDVTTVLMVKAIKSISPWTTVLCQLVLPEFKAHRHWADWDHVICLQELRTGLLAKSALCPGFATLVSNLIMSSSKVDTESLNREERKWVTEYMHGYGQEVYCLELSPAFSGHLFSVAAHKAFAMFGVCLFGIETQRVRPSNSATAAVAAAAAAATTTLGDVAGGASASSGSGGGSEVGGGASVIAGVGGSVGALAGVGEEVELTGYERQKRLRAQHVRKLGGRVSTIEMGETELETWKRERLERENGVLLINPKDYILRTGDKALLIADSYAVAARLQEWDGSAYSVPHITPADKTTFRKLNNGRGPLLRDAKPRFVSSNDVVPETSTPPPSALEAILVGASRRPPNNRRDSGGAMGVGGADGGGDAAAMGGGGDGEEEDAEGERTLKRTRRGVKKGRGKGRGSGGSGLDSLLSSPAAVRATSGDHNYSALQSTPGGRAPVLPRRLGFGSVDDARTLRGHLVVCGAVQDGGLDFLIASLRRESAKPIVVIHATTTPPQLVLAPSVLRDVFFVCGSPLRLSDLRRAGMETASAAIILSRPSSDAAAEVDELDGVRDLTAVFATCVIETHFRQCRLVVEIIDPESMKFMSFTPSRDTLPRSLWPQYACGRVFISSALDTLLCQSFYNTALIPVVTRLVMGQRDEDSRGAGVLRKHAEALAALARKGDEAAAAAIAAITAASSPAVNGPRPIIGPRATIVGEPTMFTSQLHAHSGPSPPQSQHPLLSQTVAPSARPMTTSASVPPVAFSSAVASSSMGVSSKTVGGAVNGTAPPAGATTTTTHSPLLSPVSPTAPAAESETVDGPFHAKIVGPGGLIETVEENSRVMQMQVPVPFVNRQYKDLYTELILTRGILPIAVYRSMDVHFSALPYVVANPPPHTVLHPDDRLFVLCPNSVVKTAIECMREDAAAAEMRANVDTEIDGDDSDDSDTDADGEDGADAEKSRAPQPPQSAQRRPSSFSRLTHTDAIRVAIAQTYLNRPDAHRPELE